MFAIKVTNDKPEECELWGPYDSEEFCQEVIDAYCEVPESAEIIAACDQLPFTGCPM